jgi:Fe2+ transport system protein FeoA
MNVRVKQLCGSPEVGQRLREIGLAEERMVKLLRCGANVICIVCNARLALSAQLAEGILVETVD